MCIYFQSQAIEGMIFNPDAQKSLFNHCFKHWFKRVQTPWGYILKVSTNDCCQTVWNISLKTPFNAEFLEPIPVKMYIWLTFLMSRSVYWNNKNICTHSDLRWPSDHQIKSPSFIIEHSFSNLQKKINPMSGSLYPECIALLVSKCMWGRKAFV